MSAAPGAPGLSPTWCSSAKEMVGCSLGSSRLWFTIGGGIINEVYYPRVDLPQIRDLGFIVADGAGFWVELKRLWQHVVHLAAPGVPAVRIVHRHERFELTLRVAPCEHRDVLLVEVDLSGDAELYPYALLAPHLGGTGADNQAQVLEQRGRKILLAQQGPFALALAAVTAQQQDAWGRASAGCVGSSDGWQDFARNGALSWEYDSAGPGNVALIGQLPRHAVLGLGFGSSPQSAATLALTALSEPFEVSWERQLTSWTRWHANCAEERLCADLPQETAGQVRLSTMVLRAHQDKTYPGAMVASLSVPWGNTREDRAGYHLVWPRDLVESAGALLAVGAAREARNTLRYLLATQNADGHWNQNQWLGGEGYWLGVQLDETAFPVLLAVALDERGALEGTEVADMVRRALSFLVRRGPASDQDRWEEEAGLNTFTLAVCISALVAGASYLPADGRELALAFADYWNARLEDWTSVRDAPLTRLYGVPGYYLRVAPAQALSDDRRPPHGGVLPIRNLQSDPNLPASAQVGVDFLQLVRFGLRRAEDPLIVASVKVADALLKVDTPAGPCWHRYSQDGYGEHDDGSAYDGTGRGRAWPLLTGERGHYELCCAADVLPYLSAMSRMASAGGMLPEQVWDSAPIAARGLLPGRPTGAAMPLVWAHAEYLKLVASRALKRPFDRPTSVWERYRGERPTLTRVIWSPQAPAWEMPEGCALTLALPEPAAVRWGLDGWQEVREQDTAPNSLGLHVLDIDTPRLRSGRYIDLTYRHGKRWAGRDFRILVTARAQASG